MCIRDRGTIYPGLIELHNHLAYNALRLWQVPKKYGNRDQWSGIPEYRRLISGPMQVVGKTPSLLPALVRYVECKCLLGGVTTSQGIQLFSNAGVRRFYRGVVRNAEQTDEADLPEAVTRIDDVDAGNAELFLARLKKQTCFLLHLSEGADRTARDHFLALQMPSGDWAITPQLAGIHCTALTPADFAIGEQRFAKQFRWLAAHEEDLSLPIAEFVELPAEQRTARVPFVFTTDRSDHLVKMACSASIVALVEDRRRYWRTLQFLDGRSEAMLSVQHRVEVEAWAVKYSEALDSRESALDVIAKAMADLATSSEAPAGGPLRLGLGFGGQMEAPAVAAPAAATAVAERPIWLDEADVPRCNDCATCYQELPQLFEKATIVLDGQPKTCLLYTSPSPRD